MLKQRDEKERELQELMGTTTKEIWLRDLDRFEEVPVQSLYYMAVAF